MPKNIKITPASGLFDFIGNSASEGTTKTSIVLDITGNLSYSIATGLKSYIFGLGLDSSKIMGTANQLGAVHSGNAGEFTLSISNSFIFPGTARISATPSVNTDIVNKLYVDQILNNIKIRAAVKTCSVGNINLLSPGSSINGVTLVNGNRVLIKNQSSAYENGIYVFDSPTTPMIRSIDANTWESFPSSFVITEKGTVNADTLWICTSDFGGFLGTTPINYSQLNGTSPLSLGIIGTSSNATGMILSSTNVLSLQPASPTFGGIISTINQTFAGNKTFNNNLSVNGNILVNTIIDTGQKLQVNGIVKINDGTQIPGYVFTATDINGVGSWRPIETLSNNQGVLILNLPIGISTVYSFNKLNYNGAFIDYVIKNSSGQRSGTVTITSFNSSIEYTEISTQDVGTTTDLIELSVTQDAGSFSLNANSPNSTYTIKIFYRCI